MEGVKDRLLRWLEKYQANVSVDKCLSICQKLSTDEEKTIQCWSLLYDYELGKIEDNDLLAGLHLISGKTPEEINQILSES